MGTSGLFLEGLFRGDDVVFDNVVAQNHANLFALDERFGESERVGNAPFAFLIRVVNAMKVKVLAI